MNTSLPTAAATTALLNALRRVMRPLVRLMISNGVPYPMLLDLIKSEFVRIAEHEFTIEGRPQTDSRISLLTGVHRKDVRRLRSLPADEPPPSAAATLGGQIAAAWLASPALTDAHGRPMPLPRLRSVGGRISFEALVESVSKDVRPRAVLDEWIRLGAATLDPQDRVLLDGAAFVPNRGFEEKLHYFAHNGHDHLQAMAHNVGGGTPAFLDRSVHYAGLTPGTLQTLNRLVEAQAMKALQAVNRAAAKGKSKQPRDAADAVHRVNFGVYAYAEPALNDDVIRREHDGAHR